nr:AAA family ATPase [candidate division Zixibacteria bacterium]
MFYFDEPTKKNYVAPLFVTKINFSKDGQSIFLSKDDPVPNCGIQALSKIGLRTEEIAEVNQEFEKIFKGDISNPKILVQKCIDILLEETNFSINEEINPQELTNTHKLSKTMSIGLYNKSLIFVGQDTGYNMSLIEDLMNLKTKMDIEGTALSFITNEIKHIDNAINFNKSLVLPFSLNDYQISVLKGVFENKVSVITGPPGTGKSQFIMNLLINLFLNDKKVLFVCHTNEAVDVVNEKINSDFQNLLFRTGKKEFRQDLTRKFNELSLDSQKKTNSAAISLKRINLLWDNIVSNKKLLLKIDELEEKVNELYELQKIKKSIILFFKIKYYLWKLQRIPRKINVEKEIKRIEKDFFRSSREYVKSIYTRKIFKKWGASNKVKDFLHEVETTRFHEDISDSSFVKALDVLKIWSSTLKSLNRTFPLTAGIFDYVIFDEASQIDLPSAAPALYRAKNVVVVGDPMQLSHIAGITKDLDKEIAKAYSLQDQENLYPSKIRYYDVSLYRCAESCLSKPPILLAKHYRSEDQIIDLCNQVFYSGKLSVSSNLNHANWPNSLPLGIQWEDCSGTVIRPPSGSRINKDEALKVNDVFQKIIKEIKNSNLSIGIVTPYSQQQNEIYRIITKTTPQDIMEKHNVKVLTAHKFQGSEKDIMIFSMVLSSKGNGNNDRWSNAHPQILNVALSRAKYLLYIVGDKQFCFTRNGILKKIAKTYEQIKKQEKLEEQYFSVKFDSPTELLLYQKLQGVDFDSFGYKLIPKFITKRYTLDFALVGKKKLDVECDGFRNHNIVDGLPVIEDIERDEYLKDKEGWEVIRFPNHQIITKSNFVIEKILDKIKKDLPSKSVEPNK